MTSKMMPRLQRSVLLIVELWQYLRLVVNTIDRSPEGQGQLVEICLQPVFTVYLQLELNLVACCVL